MTEYRSRRAGGERRVEVLRHVVAVLAERGYDRTRFTDVAKAAGLAVSTLQFYFGSRDDMLIEGLRYSTDQEVQELLAAAGDGTPWQRLTAIVDRALDPVTEVGWRILVEFWHVAVRDPELREHSEELQLRYRGPLTEAVRQGVELGEFRLPAGETVENVVTVMVAILDGLIIPQVLDHRYYDHASTRQVVLATYAATLGVSSRLDESSADQGVS